MATELTWSGTPTSAESNATLKSHLVVTATTVATCIGTRSWLLASDCDVWTKIAPGTTNSGPGGGLLVGNAALTACVFVQLEPGMDR